MATVRENPMVEVKSVKSVGIARGARVGMAICVDEQLKVGGHF